jgi:hypothetical protein|tara:strand:+ start:818 stop:1030 length:213 start_codon:yes stop_codon:yes gene_type:complete
MRELFLDALQDKYKAQISDAKAKATVYLDNPVAIGEHPQFIEELDKLVNVISSAEENIKTIEEYFGGTDD